MDNAVEKSDLCTHGDDDDESDSSGSVPVSGTSDSTSDDDDCCSPRIGTDFQVDELPRCTLDFFLAGNGNHLVEFPVDDEQLAFAMGRPAIPVTSIRTSNDKKPDFGRDCEEQQDGDPGDDRKRKGKKKRKGNWLTFRRMRARSDQMDRVIVPGDSFSSWDETEEAAFLLGLYLFGKDFNSLRRFLETRVVTDLQHYYYSTFYGTQAYKRWVAARSNCSKRIVNGRHILVGWRQEELLRRLLPEVEESLRPELFETMAGFNKGEVSFETYVFRVRDIAGMELLVDSVGLGCGKRDLTMGSVESVQPTKKFELPPGKAFSEYTGTEMFRALSGGCRLSKSRAQDLFWEGVWPRLLAKGWSSEQSGKGPLVYMLPGIKRYSKRSSVKGKDYFDSISEVLHHVATDASLLELAELDNELMAKHQTELSSKRGVSSSKVEEIDTNGVVTERKRRPMLWLSKGTSHAWQGDGDKVAETPKEKKVDTPKEKKKDHHAVAAVEHKRSDDDPMVSPFPKLELLEQLGSGCRTGNNESTGRPEPGKPTSESTTETITTTRLVPSSASRFDLKASSYDSTRSSIEEQALTGWRTDNTHVLPSRKRSYYDFFLDSVNNASSALQLQAGVAAVGLSAQPKAFFLDNMIKQYLGNGKSVRLYGPRTRSSSQARANVADVFYKRFQEAFHSHRKEIISLVVAVHLDWQRQKMVKTISDSGGDEHQSNRSSEELKLYELPEATGGGQTTPPMMATPPSSQLPPVARCCCESVDKNLSRIEADEMIHEDGGVGDDLVGSSCLRCSSRVQPGGI